MPPTSLPYPSSMRSDYLHVLTAQLQSLHGHGQNGLCVLCYDHSIAEPCGLQPEEQGDVKRIMKAVVGKAVPRIMISTM